MSDYGAVRCCLGRFLSMRCSIRIVGRFRRHIGTGSYQIRVAVRCQRRGRLVGVSARGLVKRSG